MVRVSSVKEYFARSNTQTLKMLLAGPPGSGKTLFCASFPQVLYADMEGRLLSVRNRDVHRVPISSVADLEELRAMLAQEPDVREQALGIGVRTVVLDTVDELARILQKERLRAEKRETLSMQDWGWYGDQLRNILRSYRNLSDLNVIFTVHLRTTEDSETGRVEYMPSIQGQVGNEVAGYVDEAFLLRARPTVDENGERVVRRFLQCYPDPQYSWIKDHSGNMPQEFPMDFVSDYERMAELIFGDQRSEQTRERVIGDEPASAPKPNGKVVPEDPPLRRDLGRNRHVKPPVVDVPLPDELVTAPAAEAKVAVSEPEPEPVREERTEIAEPDVSGGPEGPKCAECGEIVQNGDIAELSEILFGEVLCHPHFSARQKKK